MHGFEDLFALALDDDTDVRAELLQAVRDLRKGQIRAVRVDDHHHVEISLHDSLRDIQYVQSVISEICAYLCYDAFYQMVQKEPRLASRVKKRRTDIYIGESNSSIKPLAFSAKKSDGLNVSLGVCDEVASWVGDPDRFRPFASTASIIRFHHMAGVTSSTFISLGRSSQVLLEPKIMITVSIGYYTMREKTMLPMLLLLERLHWMLVLWIPTCG